MEAVFIKREYACKKCNLEFDSWEPFELHHTRHAASNSVGSFPRVRLQRLRVPAPPDDCDAKGRCAKFRKVIPVVKIEDGEKSPHRELAGESPATTSNPERLLSEMVVQNPQQNETTRVPAIGVPASVLQPPVLAIPETLVPVTTVSSSLRLKPIHKMLNTAHLPAEPVPVSAGLPQNTQIPKPTGVDTVGPLLQVTGAWRNPQSGTLLPVFGSVSVPSRIPASSAPVLSTYRAPASTNRAFRALATRPSPKAPVIVHLTLPTADKQSSATPVTTNQTLGESVAPVSRVYQIQVRESIIQPAVNVTSQASGSFSSQIQARAPRPVSTQTTTAIPHTQQNIAQALQNGPQTFLINVPHTAAVLQPNVPAGSRTTCFNGQTWARLVTRPTVSSQSTVLIHPRPSISTIQTNPFVNGSIPQTRANDQIPIPARSEAVLSNQAGPPQSSSTLWTTSTSSQQPTVVNATGTCSVFPSQTNPLVNGSIPQFRANVRIPVPAKNKAVLSKQAGPQQSSTTSQAPSTSSQLPTVVTATGACSVFPSQSDQSQGSTATSHPATCPQPRTLPPSEAAAAGAGSAAENAGLAIPVVDISSPQTVAALKNLGVRHYVPLSSGSLSPSGLLAIPLVIPTSGDQRFGSLCSPGYISLGHPKEL